MLWDPRHRGRVGVGSAPRDVLAMALLRLGEDVNSADPAVLDRAAAELDELARAAAPSGGRTVGPVLKGRFVASQTFSGAAFYAPDYLPRGVDQEVLGFWFPADRRGLVVNDCMAVPASAKNPVLAHAFIDFLLDEQVALDNLSWTGYQPPQRGLTPATLTAGGYLASNLQSAMVLPKDFDRSQQLLPLEPDVEAMYDQAFEGFRRAALQEQRELSA
jgi:spermidine/putrescine transport system substrate-binding protein